MNSCIAVKDHWKFIYAQIEEEQKKLKKKEQLRRALTSETFCTKGKCAVSLMLAKLDIINTILTMKYQRNVIQMKTGRLKEYDSVYKKMQKKGLEPDFNVALERINDLIGVRAVCAYVDDIYQVAELIKNQNQGLHTGTQGLRLSEPSSDPGNSNPLSGRHPVDKNRASAPHCRHGLLGKSGSSAPL